MAVPLVDKGVVVVAVDYDIAPKGRVVSLFPLLWWKRDCDVELQMSAANFCPFRCFYR